MHAVLFKETMAFNHLQGVIKLSLSDLLNAIKGLAILTPDLEEIFESLLRSGVPKIWQQTSYLSLKPLGSYITDFIQRVTYIQVKYKLIYCLNFTS